MKRTATILLILAAIILAACQAANGDETAPPAEVSYPGPLVQVYPTITPYYPAPDDGSGSPSGVKPIYNYLPTTSDENYTRGQVFLDLKASQVVLLESLPVQINLLLKGDLPDPCHQLRVVAVTDEAAKRVDLEVYSLVSKANACITVVQPFEATITLGSFPAGSYTVYANGEKLGEFDS